MNNLNLPDKPQTPTTVGSGDLLGIIVIVQSISTQSAHGSLGLVILAKRQNQTDIICMLINTSAATGWPQSLGHDDSIPHYLEVWLTIVNGLNLRRRLAYISERHTLNQVGRLCNQTHRIGINVM